MISGVWKAEEVRRDALLTAEVGKPSRLAPEEAGAEEVRRDALLPALTRQVSLAQNAEAFAGQDGPAALQVIQVESHGRSAVGADEDRIADLDIDFGHEQSLQHTPQIRGDFFHLDDQNI